MLLFKAINLAIGREYKSKSLIWENKLVSKKKITVLFVNGRLGSIIKTSKSNKGLSKELIVLMYLLIVVLDTPSHVAALPIE